MMTNLHGSTAITKTLKSAWLTGLRESNLTQIISMLSGHAGIPIRFMEETHSTTIEMKSLNTITVEADKSRNASGTRDWGTFRITSKSYLSKEIIESLCGSHDMFGQSFTFNETKDENGYSYNGSYDCWSD